MRCHYNSTANAAYERYWKFKHKRALEYNTIARMHWLNSVLRNSVIAMPRALLNNPIERAQIIRIEDQRWTSSVCWCRTFYMFYMQRHFYSTSLEMQFEKCPFIFSLTAVMFLPLFRESECQISTNPLNTQPYLLHEIPPHAIRSDVD